MKNLIPKPAFILIAILILTQSCQKTEEATELQTCNLKAKEISTVENKVATLIYTDKINGINISNAGFFIVDHHLSQTYNLPLMVCNFPTTKYPSLKIGENMKINFSGRIEILPETVDALSTNIELTKIMKIDEEKN